jgi:peptide/nickel transport system permease protein
MTGMSRPAGARVLRGFGARAALAVVLLLLFVAVAAPVIAPYDPSAQPDIEHAKSLHPSVAHPFGTDTYSRDVLSRVIFGARASLKVAGVSVVIALLLGTAVGLLAGFAGGRTDRWLMRTVDAMLSIPRLLVLLAIVAAWGQLSVGGLALVIGVTGWPGMSRLVRAQVREIMALDYVLAARALGVRPLRIVVREVLPGVAPQVLIAATLAVASVIPLEAGLSFLGVGVRLPTPSWGNIILEGYEVGLQAWWLFVFPGLAIVITVLAMNMLGEHLRESLDPRLRAPL